MNVQRPIYGDDTEEIKGRKLKLAKDELHSHVAVGMSGNDFDF